MSENQTQAERRELRRRSRPIHGHGDADAAAELARVAEWCAATGALADVYGDGELMTQFEERVAELLGMAAARFMPSGTMAQGIALRVWCGTSRDGEVDSTRVARSSAQCSMLAARSCIEPASLSGAGRTGTSAAGAARSQ